MRYWFTESEINFYEDTLLTVELFLPLIVYKLANTRHTFRALSELTG